MTPDEAWKILEGADRLCDEATVHAAIARLAGEITARLKDRYPLVLAVMGGSIFFAGHLLARLRDGCIRCLAQPSGNLCGKGFLSAHARNHRRHRADTALQSRCFASPSRADSLWGALRAAHFRSDPRRNGGVPRAPRLRPHDS